MIKRIQELRQRTGAGFLDCKNALLSTNSVDEAVEWLRIKGISDVQKRAGRIAAQGVISTYLHAGEQVGVMLELNCETDFVSSTDQFRMLADDLAMHIAASNPTYISREAVPPESLEKERQVQLARVIEEGKPEHIAGKIVDGRLNKWLKEVCLLEQSFVQDDKLTVQDVISKAASVLKENITVGKFNRFVVGER